MSVSSLSLPQTGLGSTAGLEEPTYSVVSDLHGVETLQDEPSYSPLADASANQVRKRCQERISFCLTSPLSSFSVWQQSGKEVAVGSLRCPRPEDGSR